MNAKFWISHFERNAALTRQLALPTEICRLPRDVKEALAASLAIFQLGESGGGTRLRRYAKATAPLENLRGYQQAVDRFIAEEQGHAQLLARVLCHLGGTCLKKQWSNTVFRQLRGLVNLEFAIQVLLTAELVAEVYYGSLFLRVDDPVVKVASRQILRDEMKHLRFQREFLSERLRSLNPVAGWLWRTQFKMIHAITIRVVAWDHRKCFKAIGLPRQVFLHQATESWERFQKRLEKSWRSCGTHTVTESMPASPHGKVSSSSFS